MSSTRSLTIDGFTIDDDSDAYVIAEIGHNHMGSIEVCKQLFDEARRCGAHAVKLQKRHNRTLFTRAGFDAPYENPNSYAPTYGEHREALEFDHDQYVELIDYAKKIGVTFFATAFDEPSADFLAELDMPAYKIASADIVNTPLLRHVAELGRPMVLSSGGATLQDVRRGVECVREINPDVAILQCTAGYPAAWDELDLRVIETFRSEFPETTVGLSSHDNGIAMTVAGYTLGARIVEKHFTLDRTNKGTDHVFSLEPQGLRKMCRDLQRLRIALGDGSKNVHPSETAPVIKMAKKLVAARDLPAGHVLGADDVTQRSPGDGMAPHRLDEVLGKRLRKPMVFEQAMGEELLEEATEAASAAHG